MDALILLGTVVGLPLVTGINLYATVLTAGLLIRLDLITLGPQFQQLEVLGSWWVISIAGILYFVEFFADKIPWLDSAWDAVHTFIRVPAGAALAMAAAGSLSPEVQVCAALLGGTIALTTHSAKAGVRLAVNTSPEPFSNSAVSLVEDAVVVGGTMLAMTHPVIALVVGILFLMGCLYFIAKLGQALRYMLRKVIRLFSGAPPATAA